MPQTATELVAAYRAKELSPVEETEATLRRIEERDGELNSIVDRFASESAGMLSEAPEGPLHGVPIVVKDNYWTKGVETTANSYIFDGFVPEEDATCVARLLAAGAVIEPPVWVPMLEHASRPAVAVADPEDDPPGS